MSDDSALLRALRSVSPVVAAGTVVNVRRSSLGAKLMGVSVGQHVRIVRRDDPAGEGLLAEVLAVRGNEATLAPFGSVTGVSAGCLIETVDESENLPRESLLGTVVDGFGRILRRSAAASYPIPHPAEDNECDALQVFPTGLRAIDAFLTLGYGQRLAVFAEPGVGKSSLMCSIARESQAEVNVIALIGERRREIAELTASHSGSGLDAATMSKTVVVAAPASAPALLRSRAADYAARAAEYFCRRGSHVLLQIDSLTRLCRAYRELGLAAGESPVRRGYPVSVYSRLQGLIDRAGAGPRGSITALYTVLLSGELEEDPMVEEVKGLTDGHIMLNRELANRGRYPAIDLLASVSRFASKLHSGEQKAAAASVRSFIAAYAEEKEIALLGGQVAADFADKTALNEKIEDYLKQPVGRGSALEETLRLLIGLGNSVAALSGRKAGLPEVARQTAESILGANV